MFNVSQVLCTELKSIAKNSFLLCIATTNLKFTRGKKDVLQRQIVLSMVGMYCNDNCCCQLKNVLQRQSRCKKHYRLINYLNLGNGICRCERLFFCNEKSRCNSLSLRAYGQRPCNDNCRCKRYFLQRLDIFCNDFCRCKKRVFL